MIQFAGACVFVVLVCLAAPVAAACHAEKEATLPVTFQNRMPTVPVLLNGQAVNLAIDSGAQITVVAPEIATQLQLPTDSRYYYSRIRGTSGAYQTVNAVVRTLRFAGVDYKKKRVNVIPLNSVHKDGVAFVPLNGLIGADILTDYAFEYDAAGSIFSFFPVDTCKHGRPDWKGKYVRVPVSITESNAIALPVTVNGQKLTGIFDTGAAVTTMTLSAAKRLGVTKEAFAADKHMAETGVGGNPRVSSLHQFDSMAIAGEKFAAPRITVANFAVGEADMLIGEDYMRGRRFWISYADEVLYMQKVAKP